MYMSYSEGMSEYGFARRTIFTCVRSSSSSCRLWALLGRRDCEGASLTLLRSALDAESSISVSPLGIEGAEKGEEEGTEKGEEKGEENCRDGTSAPSFAEPEASSRGGDIRSRSADCCPPIISPVCRVCEEFGENDGDPSSGAAPGFSSGIGLWFWVGPTVRLPRLTGMSQSSSWRGSQAAACSRSR